MRVSPRSLPQFGNLLTDKITIGVQVRGYGNHMEAIVVEIIGFEGEGDYYRKLLLAQSGAPQNFDPAVLAEADTFKVPTGQIPNNRADYRDHTICTIDGEDAKDLDDAIEITKTPTGFLLTVHIADVAEYVQPNSELDRSAISRGTSIYLVNQVIPMLPPRLSDSLCSLQSDAPKLCLSAEIRLDQHGNVRETRLFESMIQSSYRATYTEVENDHLGKETPLPEAVRIMLRDAWDLKKVLDKRRQAEGKIDFPSTENKLILENNKLVEIRPVEHLEAHELIEQFMVLANEEVSKWLSVRNLDTVYRIHSEPTQSGIGRLTDILAPFGLSLILANPLHPQPKEIQRAMELLRTKDTE